MTAYLIESDADLGGALRNLNHLLGTICEIRFELSQGEGDNRVDSLLWIARDMSEGIVAFTETPKHEVAK